METIQLPKYYSPSQVNEFNQCPRMWGYRRAGVPTIQVEEDKATLGSFLHNQIREYYDVIRPPINPQLIEATFGDIVARNWETLPLKQYSARKDKVVENFVAFEKRRLESWRNYRPTFVEQRLTTNEFVEPLVAIVDAYWEGDKTAVNWKTGNVSEISSSMLLQGKIESVILEANGYPVEKYIFALLYSGRWLEMPKLTSGIIIKVLDEMRQSKESGVYLRRESYLCDRWCEFNLRCRLEKEGKCLWGL